MKIGSRILIVGINGYQRWISPLLGPRCRYYPTCSQYAIEALSTHGAIKGSLLATGRILRCNPWSNGGVNHIPEQGKWRGPIWEPPADWVGHNIPDRSLPKRARNAQKDTK